MRLTWNSGLAERESLREQWNALVFQMEKPEVFYTWEWAAALSRAPESGVEPWIATAYEGDELVGVAALAKSSATNAGFLAGNTADYCDFISLPGRRREFVAQVLQSVREAGIRKLALANIPADSATVAELRDNRSYKSFLRTGYICAQVRLGTEEERQLLVSGLQQKKVFRRSLNALQRLGPVSLQHEMSGSKEHVIDRFCSTHVERFLSTGRISNLASAPRREFLKELARLLAEKGWFDLTILRVGSWVLALNYGFRFHGTWFWYQPTIVNKFEELSPGYCLLAKIVEDACRNPEVRMVDLGLGAEEYKERFANAERTTLYVTLTSSKRGLWKVKGRYYAAEGIKRRAGLEQFARGMQRMVRDGRQKGWRNVLAETVVRSMESVASADEVLLFQWPAGNDAPEEQAALMPLTWEILGAAAIRYSTDRETMDYLLRSAARFRLNQSRGYALTGADGVAQHVLWVAAYEEVGMAELGEVLRAPSASSVMIFDCWTPRELRGQGIYTRAIGWLAGSLCRKGKDVWTFGSKHNTAAVAGIEEAGFQRKASLCRRKVLGWRKTRQECLVAPCEGAEEP